MAEILKGKPVADEIKLEVSKKIDKLSSRGIIPKLGIIRVGERSDDLYYEGSIKRVCSAVKLDCEVFPFEKDIDQAAFEKAVVDIVKKADISGILMFAPLPKQLDENKIRSLIPLNKDVDCMNIINAGKVYTGDSDVFPPCTPAACIEMLHFYNIPIKGKRCVVLGRSLVVGKPIAMLLLKEQGTVTICHSKTVDLPKICQEADILIAAVGRAKMVNADFVLPGQVIIDVGMNEDPSDSEKCCGDVDFASVEKIVEKISPVPAGVGSITAAMLCKHTVQAAERLNLS